MNIGITYNLKDEPSIDSILDSEHAEEFDTAQTIDAICAVLAKSGFRPVKLGWGVDIIDKIKKEKIDFVFNIAEGHRGRTRESQIPAILEMLGVPYSGSDSLTLGMTLDKRVTKKILKHAEIPTPYYYIVNSLDDVKHVDNILQYPMVTKPSWEGSSKGIYNSSKVFEKQALESSLKELSARYPGQPLLVEEYIRGREITAGVIGNTPPRILGLMEIRNKDIKKDDFFYSLEVKRDWKNLVEYIVPPDITPALDTKIRKHAMTAFRDFNCRDIARIDFRISEYDEPFLLEINPLPGLSPDYADLVIMAARQGINYESLILAILTHAFSRYGFEKEHKRLMRVI